MIGTEAQLTALVRYQQAIEAIDSAIAEEQRSAEITTGVQPRTSIIRYEHGKADFPLLGNHRFRLIGERQENLRPQHPAAQQDKAVGRTELPHRGAMLRSKGAKDRSASHRRIH